jgi:heat shock 70kDa protein 4
VLPSQDWLYEEGEDTSKAIYVAKMEEVRFIAGPIIQRYLDKVEADRQAILKAQEEEVARKQAEEEAKRRAEEGANKAEEAKKEGDDTEMKEAPMADDGEPTEPIDKGEEMEE